MDTQQDQLQLVSDEVGAHPVIQPLIDRLRLREFFAAAFGQPDTRLQLPDVDGALLLVRNFVLSRHPLYGVADWARRFHATRLELTDAQVALINDDRLGRLLDKLFCIDRRTLMTRIIVHMVQEFGIEMARIHNDSTSITFCGEYRNQAPRADAHHPPRINAMAAHEIDSLPIYPESRSCKAPTTGKILALFASLRRHRLLNGDRHVKTFWDPITDAQRAVLKLLDVPLSQFGAES